MTMIRQAVLPAVCLFATAACGTRDLERGRPPANSMSIAPDKVMDFNFGGANDWEQKEQWTIRYDDNKVDIDSKTIIHKYVNVDGKEDM